MSGRLRLLRILCAVAAVAVAGCERAEKDAPKDEPAPSAAGPLRISAKSQAAMGLVVEAVATRAVGDSLAATGWLSARPGGEVVIKAPAAGFVLPVADGKELAAVGSRVKEGDPLASLDTLLSPLDQAQLVGAKTDAQILIRQSLVSMQTAQAQLERLKNTRDVVAGTRLAELQETYDRARIAHEEALKKLPVLPQDAPADATHLKLVPVLSPLAGRVTAVEVGPRQFVAAGDPLWTVADWSALWLRVPVFVDDLPRVMRQENAHVTPPGTRLVLEARPIDTVQPAKPGRQTVDLFYELASADGQILPGQSVQVLLATGKTAERIVVPRGAILWDGAGGAWVYRALGPTTFNRQKVELGAELADGVVVLRGLATGERVVTAGAEVLYGEEFKSQLKIGGEKEGEGE
ncbi:MAG: efflux RND transporter periplasmic adaptor subunit [Pirellulales bacterium]